MKFDDMEISPDLKYYLHVLSVYPRNEVYETLCLMILNEEYLRELELLINSHKKQFKIINGNFDLSIATSKAYKNSIDKVCKSKYFKDKFSKQEIQQKKIIASNLILELITQVGVMWYGDKNKIQAKPIIRYGDVIYPGLNHKIDKSGDYNIIELTFHEGTPLNVITDYLKDTLEVKNYPRKKTLSIGRGIRILQIENKIKNNPEQYPRDPNLYTEQLIAREMLRIYKEDLSMELISKSLVRVKKIRKDINVAGDK